MEKHKFATISLTVRDRAISLKFSIHRVSEKCTLGNFQKIFLFPHIEFSNFCQKWEKNKFRQNFRPTGYLSNVLLAIFKNFPLPKHGGHFEFLPKIEKQKFASISLTMQDRAISSKFLTQPMQKGMKLK